MGRKMFAYLGYLDWSAEGWSMSGLVLSQIQVSWNMEYLEGMKWMEWMASHLNYLNSIICNFLGCRVDFSFFFSLFFKEDSSTLFCWYNLNSWEFWLGSSRGMNGGIGTVIAGEYSWQKWMSVPEMGDWQARYAWASKWWIYEGWRPVDGKYHSRSGCTIRQSSK